jgi:hypothetical protein
VKGKQMTTTESTALSRSKRLRNNLSYSSSVSDHRNQNKIDLKFQYTSWIREELNWKSSNISYISLTPAPTWKSSVEETATLFLQRIKSQICGKRTAFNRDVQINAFLFEERLNRHSGQATPHGHMLVTIDNVDFPPILEMLIYSLLNLDRKQSREETIGSCLTTEQRETAQSWLSSSSDEIVIPISLTIDPKVKPREVTVKNRKSSFAQMHNCHLRVIRAGDENTLFNSSERSSAIVSYLLKNLELNPFSRSSRRADRTDLLTRVTPILIVGS